MSQKNKKNKHHHGQPKNQLTNMPKAPSWHLPLILILTFAAYIPALNAGFVNWDDDDYVLNNPLIRDFSNLDLLLTQNVQGNHHPLTMFSLAINYMISGTEAWSYHLFNILLHLVNCVLVYRFIFLLSRGNAFVALTTGILFGIHPMHVESVAWVSERKDLLYTLFFVAGHTTYLRYTDSGNKKFYWQTALLLVLSLLSKPAAVIFPVSLLCIDFFREQKISFKLITNKIPFFILSFAMGLITYFAQKGAGSIEGESFGFVNSMFFGFYGIMMYLVKLIFPIGLSAFFPFPPVNESLPAAYYFSPLITIGLVAAAWYFRNKYRYITFGISFYIINLLLVLQVLSVGSAVIAERYTYVPYIGLFFLVGYLFEKLLKSQTTRTNYILLPLSFLFAVLTFFQCKTWESGATLWDNVINTNPSSRAYSARATLYRLEKNYPMAVEYNMKAISLNMIDHESYNNLGNIYMDLDKLDSAGFYYKEALRIKPDYHTGWDNTGAMYARKKQFDSALICLDKALILKPGYKPAYSNRALTYMGLLNYEKAITDWQSFLQYEPGADDIMNEIGLCYRMLKKYNEAVQYSSQALALNDVPQYHLNRAYAYLGLQNFEEAKKDALIAKQAGIPLEANFASILGIQQ
jgi:protein O-mannosyl-transferase